MTTLGQIINETRITVSEVLNDLQDKGLVELRRGSFIIYDADKLLTKS